MKKYAGGIFFAAKSAAAVPQGRQTRQRLRPFGRARNPREQMLPAGKTVIRNFLGTGMISVMPVLLLSVHPWE